MLYGKSLNFLRHTLWGATTEAKSMTYNYLASTSISRVAMQVLCELNPHTASDKATVESVIIIIIIIIIIKITVQTHWSNIWLMPFNLNKCEHLTITNKFSPSIYYYKLNDYTIQRVQAAKYLGLTISHNLSFVIICHLSQPYHFFGGILISVHVM